MATFIDEDMNSPTDEELEPQTDLEQQPEEPEQTTEPPEEEEIPDKYKGKSVKDIVRMHQEAEKALGKQGSEVGELRRVVDDFIRAQTVTNNKAPDVDEEVDFFADPDKAVAKAIERHPKVKQAEMLAAQMKKAEALANLKTAHPDFEQIVNDPSFGEWVGKSKVRQQLFMAADKMYDFDAANELLETWKERRQVVEQTKVVEQQTRKNAVKAASTGSGRGSGESPSKPVFRRADIIELMQNDPERYMARADEIMLAYREGRVK
jgi:hypothetical protein